MMVGSTSTRGRAEGPAPEHTVPTVRQTIMPCLVCTALGAYVQVHRHEVVIGETSTPARSNDWSII